MEWISEPINKDSDISSRVACILDICDLCFIHQCKKLK